MPIDSRGRWSPQLSPKQQLLIETCRTKRFVLANGPRFSGKTMGAYAALCDHAWNVSPANICMISISQTVGMDSGVWRDLTRIIIPDRIGGNFGFQWVLEPYIQGVSKKPTCEVTNYRSLQVDTNGMTKDERIRALRDAGATTEIQLESLRVEAEVEDRFKPRRYSMIYVPELSSFHQRLTFNTWTECLRMLGLPEEKHLFLADSNPPDADSWWVHDLWWDLLEADEEEIDPIDYGFPEYTDGARDAVLALKHGLARIDINIEDNPFADAQHVLLLKAKYAHNDEMYRRYILGECVQTTEGSHFQKVFRQDFHCRGDIETRTNPDPEMLVPPENCHQLYSGWDPGDSVNSAFVIASIEHPTVTVETKNGPMERVIPVLLYLDELVITGQHHSIEAFVLEAMKKMQFWEEQIGHPGSTQWVHWSDRSVFDRYSTESERYVHQIIFDCSIRYLSQGDVKITGPIILNGADRSPRSIILRVDLWSKLMFENRVFMSNPKTPKLIAATKGLKRGRQSGHTIQKGLVHKHVFDAATYLAASELQEELTRTCIDHISNTRRQETSLVMVPL